MKSNKMKFIMLVLASIFCITTVVYATPSSNFPSASGHGTLGNVATGIQPLWGTVMTVVQILAFGAIVFAGIRYMFASADSRADIKGGIVMLIIGAVLVFATSTLVKFVVSAADIII